MNLFKRIALLIAMCIFWGGISAIFIPPVPVCLLGGIAVGIISSVIANELWPLD